MFVFCPYISTQLELTAKKLGREGRKEKGGRKEVPVLGDECVSERTDVEESRVLVFGDLGIG